VLQKYAMHKESVTISRYFVSFFMLQKYAMQCNKEVVTISRYFVLIY